ncbi:MAG: hypothetical protein GXX86_11980 [Propionibacterium sp.]|nr:hypothetical protein [Propionibacterium sp.]
MNCICIRKAQHFLGAFALFGCSYGRLVTVARIVVELALQSLPWSVAAGDLALHRHDLTPSEVVDVVAELGRRTGIARARQLAPHLDARSESVAESLSRVHLAEAGIPSPEPQLWVGNDHRPIARIDFAWTKYRVAGECDGIGKYFDSAGGGPQAALRREKRRDGDLIDLGWTPVHWTYSEILNGAMARRVAHTLVRNGWDGRRT